MKSNNKFIIVVLYIEQENKMVMRVSGTDSLFLNV